MEIIYKLTPAEAKLADIIWTNTAMLSPELVQVAENELGWKRTTTYTILKRMCDKGIMQNNNAVVSAAVTRDEYFAGQSRDFIQDIFGGSLPLFLTSFINGKKLSAKQTEELQRFIEEHKDDKDGGENG